MSECSSVVVLSLPVVFVRRHYMLPVGHLAGLHEGPPGNKIYKTMTTIKMEIIITIISGRNLYIYPAVSA